jgi:DNA repair protein RAD5
MMDTWWNEAIEQQAIDRVHRLGQNKPVFVTRYIIKGTVGGCCRAMLTAERC